MPESNIDLILRTKREGDAPKQAVEDLDQMKSGLTNLEKAMAGTRSTIGDLDTDIGAFGANLGSATDLLSGFGISIPISPMQLFGYAIGAAASFIKSSLSDYSSYIEQVDRISTYTGMASEETSKLIQVSDDLRIETNTLEMALKTMAQNGTTPSIEGLGQLSDQYLAIQDPLARAQFLTANFGRSGVEMARMMELGSEQIRLLSDEVSKYMIVTGKSKEQAEAYIKALDDWNDAVLALKYSIASGLTPALTSLIQFLNGPSADSAANVINTIFKGTFLDNSKKQIDEITGAWKEATGAVTGYGNAVDTNVHRGMLNERSNYGNIYNQTPLGRAGGGPVFPMETYKVGEREIEYLTMGAPGAVVPASAGGQQQIIFNYQPIVSLADQAEAKRVLLPYIQEALR